MRWKKWNFLLHVLWSSTKGGSWVHKEYSAELLYDPHLEWILLPLDTCLMPGFFRHVWSSWQQWKTYINGFLKRFGSKGSHLTADDIGIRNFSTNRSLRHNSHGLWSVLNRLYCGIYSSLFWLWFWKEVSFIHSQDRQLIQHQSQGLSFYNILDEDSTEHLLLTGADLRFDGPAQVQQSVKQALLQAEQTANACVWLKEPERAWRCLNPPFLSMSLEMLSARTKHSEDSRSRIKIKCAREQLFYQM